MSPENFFQPRKRTYSGLNAHTTSHKHQLLGNDHAGKQYAGNTTHLIIMSS